MIKFNFSYIILFIIVAACGSPKSEEEFIVQNGDTLRIIREYDLEGNLKSERMIDKDSLTQGTGKIFYEDGTLHAELSFKDDKKDGLEKSYYKSGKIKHTGLNRLGKQDSIWIWYYNSGAIEEMASWINGASHGEDISFYKNGNVKMFRFYHFGNLLYIREYDSVGNIVKDEGKMPLSIAYNRNNFKTGEIFNMVILVGLLPLWNATLEICDEQGKIIKKVNHKNGFEKAAWGKRIIVEDVASKVGTYKWFVNITVTDERGKKMEYSKTFTRTVTNE